jgi:hypothetical protein
LYIVQALTGILSAFQRPAYTASISLLVPRKHLSRANGMRSLAVEGSNILAPFLAGLLIVSLGMASVMIVDIITFLISAYTLYIVRIPHPRATKVTDDAPEVSFWEQVIYGFTYIFQRRGLMWLMFVFTGINFTAAAISGMLRGASCAASGGTPTVSVKATAPAARQIELLNSKMKLPRPNGQRGSLIWRGPASTAATVGLHIVDRRPNIIPFVDDFHKIIL